METPLPLLFTQPFTKCKTTKTFAAAFFKKSFGLNELKRVHDWLIAESLTLSGKKIPSAVRVQGKDSSLPPFALLVQLHGNEPAGLAAVALVLALSEAGALERDVICVIGNPLASAQFFEAWKASPNARQETRDAFRCGLDEAGNLLPDMNRIPLDFLTSTDASHHTTRARELYAIGQHVMGILDIHSARGDLICITEHKRDADLQGAPIRTLLTGLAEAIAAHASAKNTVQTLKNHLFPLPNLLSQTGIEVGRHEDEDAPEYAAQFTLQLLHAAGISAFALPDAPTKNEPFIRVHVAPKITYADLNGAASVLADDVVYMAKPCATIEEIPQTSGQVLVAGKDGKLRVQSALSHIIAPSGELRFAVHQYEELEDIAKNQVVAVAVPSGAELRAPSAFCGIFVSKAKVLYDRDPAVGPWPVSAADLAAIKFCYPCTREEITLAS